jgi:hypothetical protein
MAGVEAPLVECEKATGVPEAIMAGISNSQMGAPGVQAGLGA